MSEREPEVCDVNIIHPDDVKKALDKMPVEEARRAMLDILTAMADSTRLQILLALKDQELCVCDLSAVLCMSQSAVSHQLRTLRDVHCVKSRRSGKVIFYALDDDHVCDILNVALSHVSEGR
jgi:ArsR family transcriptional regulator, lead/cadmium/zinc/bismuth-responsive transcriptional repressor